MKQNISGRAREDSARLLLTLPVGLLLLAGTSAAWALSISPASVSRTVTLGSTVSQTFTVSPTNISQEEAIVQTTVTAGGVPTTVNYDGEFDPVTVNYSVTISQPSEHCSALFPNDGVVASGELLACQLNVCTTQASAPVSLTYVDPLTVATSSSVLSGTPGESVEFSTTFSGGRAPYSATSALGATVTLRNGALDYQYAIPVGASGTLSDTVTISGVTTSCGGDSATISVRIDVTEVSAPIDVSPSTLGLTASSGATVQADFRVSGGTAPYNLTAVSGTGSVSPSQLSAPGTATYTVGIPENTPAGTTLRDTIVITDALGARTELPVTVTVAVFDPLSGRQDLTENERNVASAIETVCPQLAQMTSLTADQQDLLNECTDMLQNASSSGIPNTLSQVTTEKARASTSAGIEVGTQQLANIGSRLAALRRGSAGIDLAGLSFNVNGERISGGQLGSALQSQLMGGAASGDGAGTFGNWGFFLTGTFNFGDKDRTANESGFDFDSIAITGGADYRFSDNFIAGAALGYAQNDVDFASDGGRLDTDTWHLAAYATYYITERAYLDAIVEYGWQDHDSKRNVAYQISSSLDPVRRQAKASYDGNQLGASLGAGYDIDQGPLSYGIYGRVGYLKVDVDGFRESGAGGLNLEVDGFDATSVTTTLGARVSRVFNTTRAVIVPQARVEWEHEYDDDASRLVARFSADPTRTSFDIRTDSPDRDYFRIGLGVSALFPQGLSAFVNYNTLIDKSDWTDHLIDVGMRWEFY
ncbi:MAG: autotransporter domain-containing protein [Chromatiaceae bacterium]|jgi:outer membrane autotransporter protein|nr:autotransporter domain-containing protein [Chromatiaceae bacterium]